MNRNAVGDPSFRHGSWCECPELFDNNIASLPKCSRVRSGHSWESSRLSVIPSARTSMLEDSDTHHDAAARVNVLDDGFMQEMIAISRREDAEWEAAKQRTSNVKRYGIHGGSLPGPSNAVPNLFSPTSTRDSYIDEDESVCSASPSPPHDPIAQARWEQHLQDLRYAAATREAGRRAAMVGPNIMRWPIPEHFLRMHGMPAVAEYLGNVRLGPGGLSGYDPARDLPEELKRIWNRCVAPGGAEWI